MMYIQNIECGNIFPYSVEGVIEIRKEAMELYGVDDNASIVKYYQLIKVE